LGDPDQVVQGRGGGGGGREGGGREGGRGGVAVLVEELRDLSGFAAARLACGFWEGGREGGWEGGRMSSRKGGMEGGNEAMATHRNNNKQI